MITAVGLQAGGVERSMHLAGHSVEIKVAHRVRSEMLFALAAKGRDLKIQITGGFLVSEDAVIILLVLIFIRLAELKVPEGRMPSACMAEA